MGLRPISGAGILWCLPSGERLLGDHDLAGLKYFRQLQPLLARLHEVGCERDVAGKRDLHRNQYCTLILIWRFSPLVDSLQGLQHASELEKVRKKSSVGRVSVGSLSESVTIFDPEPLQQIAAELPQQVPGPKSSPFDAAAQPIATHRRDLPAQLVSEIEADRAVLPLLQARAGLLSDDQRGIEIQTYCAIITCMLISLTTGRKPTLRTYEMICYYFTGLADEDELLARLAKLKTHEA